VALQAQSVGRIAFERFTLPNGLEVVLAPDHATQVAAVDVWYQAGSRDDPAGKGGLASLFDELMFAGSANVPPGGHTALLERGGGQVSSAVDEDVSRFSESVPSNRLDQALWLEAERMRGIVINDTTVARSRAALLDELRSRAEGEAYSEALLTGTSALYDSAACPGYSHPPTGSAQSLQSLTVQDAQDFFHRHYGPSNARLVVSGDFDPARARSLVTQYFGGIPGGSPASAPPCRPQPSAGSARRTVTDRLATRPAVALFYRIPAHEHADSPALQLLGIILGQGQESRISRHLLGEVGAAAGAQAGILGTRRGPGAFGFFAVADSGVTPDSLATLLAAEAAWAAGPGLGEAELARARNIYLATAVSGRQRPGDIAEALQHAATYDGSLDAVNTEAERVLQVTRDDLRRVAAAWLRPDNLLTLVITPETAP
jgi:zinc protease